VRRRSTRSLILSVSAALALAPATASAACTGADAQPSARNAAQARAAIVCLVNQQRARHGLRKLRLDARLSRAAKRHSRNMRDRRFFDHVSPGGSTPISRIRHTGYLARASRYAISENIAWGAGRFATPTAIVRMWMRSSGHRRNILTRRYRDLGVGIAFGTPGTRDLGGAIYTTTFGSRSS
jgi:uncharacterized protein YkwD